MERRATIKRVITTWTKKITQIMPILLSGTLRPHREFGSKDMAEIRPTTKSLMEKSFCHWFLNIINVFCLLLICT